MLWTRAVRRAPMTPLRLVLAGAAGSAAADFGDQDPRGLTHTVIGSLVVRGNRLAISNSSSLSGCELHGSSLRARLPAADFGDQVDLALGFRRARDGQEPSFGRFEQRRMAAHGSREFFRASRVADRR